MTVSAYEFAFLYLGKNAPLGKIPRQSAHGLPSFNDRSHARYLACSSMLPATARSRDSGFVGIPGGGLRR
jgi:hypothetical protein